MTPDVRCFVVLLFLLAFPVCIGFAAVAAASAAAVAITALLPVCICLRFPVVFPEADVHLLLPTSSVSLPYSRVWSLARLVPLL